MTRPALAARTYSDGAAALATMIRLTGLPAPVAEYRFDPARQWRFDFAWPDRRLAVEIEGGTWTRGRHNRPGGYERDCRKYSEAAIAGWRVLRFSPRMVRSGEALQLIERALQDLAEQLAV